MHWVYFPVVRVAFVVGEFPKASETFIQRQMVALAKRGFAVTVFGVRPSRHPLPDPEVEQYGLLARTHYREPGDARAELAWPVTKPFDVVHAHFGPQGLLVQRARARRAGGAPLVTTFHGYDAHLVARGNRVGIYDRLFAEGDWFTANTHYTRDVIARLGCPTDRTTVLPMGLRFPLIERRPHVGGTPRRLLSVARHVEKKGLEDGIRAFARLDRSTCDVVYDLVGEGPLTPRLQHVCEQLGLERRVRFHGTCSQERVLGLMDAADVFVLPSVTAENGDMEGQALVLQEAQSRGLPVVSTWHNGIPEGVWHRKTGLLVMEHDVEALASAIDSLLVDDEARVEMGRAGIAFVREHYDTDALTDRLVSVYENAIRYATTPRSRGASSSPNLR